MMAAKHSQLVRKHSPSRLRAASNRAPNLVTMTLTTSKIATRKTLALPREKPELGEALPRKLSLGEIADP